MVANTRTTRTTSNNKALLLSYVLLQLLVFVVWFLVVASTQTLRWTPSVTTTDWHDAEKIIGINNGVLLPQEAQTTLDKEIAMKATTEQPDCIGHSCAQEEMQRKSKESTTTQQHEETPNNNNGECDQRVQKILLPALDQGQLSYARYLAGTIQRTHPHCEKVLAATYVKHADRILEKHFQGNDGKQIIQPYPPKLWIDEEHCWTGRKQLQGGSKVKLEDDYEGDYIDREKAAQFVLSQWDACCSQLSSPTNSRSNEDDDRECIPSDDLLMQPNQPHHTHPLRRMCCSFFQGSLSNLRLPVLQELALHLRLNVPQATRADSSPAATTTSTWDFTVEQDGFLRKFDVSSILWPTGYLMTLCLADPIKCGIPELVETLQPRLLETDESGLIAIELGAGVGAPAIALARFIHQQLRRLPARVSTGDNNRSLIPRYINAKENAPRVVATDKALQALALTVVNSRAAGVPVMVLPISDHTNITLLGEAKDKVFGKNSSNRFSVVLGSSLQSLFDYKTNDSGHQLWNVLDELMELNSDALAILAHAVEAVQPPRGGRFRLVRQVSGDRFDMMTRGGDSSDFSVSVYRRIIAAGHGKRIDEGEL